jgi:hypothetical protein
MRNPRITVNVKPEVAEVLRRTATATEQTVSGMVADLLEMVSPVLARVAALHEMAAQARTQATEGLKESLEAVQDELEPVLLRALDVMGVTPERKVAGSARERRPLPERSGTPAGVITGVTKSRRGRKAGDRGGF